MGTQSRVQPTNDFDLPVSSLERDRLARMDNVENRSLSAMDTYRFIGDGPNAFGYQQAALQQEGTCTWCLKRCALVLLLFLLADLIFLTVRSTTVSNAGSQAPPLGSEAAAATGAA